MNSQFASSRSSNTLEQEITRLNQVNQSQNSELETLRRQFQDAIANSSKVEEVCKQNFDLLGQIRVLNGEKDELKQRLQISLQSNDEQKNKFLQEIDQLKIDGYKEKDIFKRKMEEECKIHQNEISIMNESLKNTEENLIKSQRECEKLKLETEIIFKAASEHFENQINDLDTLIKYFAEPLPKPIIQIKEVPVKPKKLITKNKKEKNDNSQVDKYQKQIELVDAKYKQEIDELIVANEEYKNKIERQTQEIDGLKSMNEKYITDLSKQKTRSQMEKQNLDAKAFSEAILISEQLKSVTKQFNDTLASHETLKKQMSHILSKSQKSKKKNIEYKNQLKKTELHNQELELENTEMSHKISELEDQLNENETKYSAVTRRVQELQTTAKTQKSLLTERNSEIERLRQLSEGNSALTIQQNDIIDNLKHDKESISQVVQEQENCIHQLEEKIRFLENQLNESRKSAQQAQQQLINYQESYDGNQLLPLAAWSCPEFPQELENIVKDLVSNHTLQTPTKLRHVLSVTAKWFIAHNERTDKDCAECKSLLFKYEQQIQSQIEFLEKVFPDLDIEFKIDEETQNIIEEALRNLRMKAQKAVDAKEKIEKEMLDLLITLESDNLFMANSKAHELIDQLKALKGKLNKKKGKTDENKNKYEEMIRKLTNDLNQSKLQKSEIENQYKDFENQKKEFLNQVNELEGMILDEKHKNEQKIHDLEVAHEAKTTELSKHNKEILSDFHKVKEENSRLHNDVKELEEQAVASRQTIQILSKDKERKKSELKAAKIEMENLKKENQDRVKAEREVIQNRYEQLINQLKVQINEYQITINQLNETSTLYNDQVTNLKKQNSDLELKSQRLEMRIKSVHGEVERDKKLFESQMNAKLITEKAEFQKQIDDLRSKLQEAKRDLMGRVTMHFCSLYDVNSKLDESSFEILIQNIKSRLTELSELDTKLRILLELGPKQSIEQAISALMLNRQI